MDDDRLHGSVPDRAETALLVLDMFSNFAFKDGTRAAQLALPVAKCIALQCAAASRGGRVAALLQPDERDYCLLKTKHSAFFDTPLDTVLEALGARRLILTGTTTPQCILFTATDAYVREYELSVPSDCVVALTPQQQRVALYFLRNILAARVCRANLMRA